MVYLHPAYQPNLPLYNSAGQVVGYLQHANHQYPHRTTHAHAHSYTLRIPAGGHRHHQHGRQRDIRHHRDGHGQRDPVRAVYGAAAEPVPGLRPRRRTTIQTEMVAMNLTGNSGVFGPVTIHESPSLVSPGQISQQTPGVDFPADSFFDVFVEVQTSMGVLHTAGPDPHAIGNQLHTALWDYLHTAYQPEHTAVQLVRADSGLHTARQPLLSDSHTTPTRTLRLYARSRPRGPIPSPPAANVTIDITGVGTDNVTSDGPSTVQSETRAWVAVLEDSSSPTQMIAMISPDEDEGCHDQRPSHEEHCADDHQIRGDAIFARKRNRDLVAKRADACEDQGGCEKHRESAEGRWLVLPREDRGAGENEKLAARRPRCDRRHSADERALPAYPGPPSSHPGWFRPSECCSFPAGKVGPG